MIIDGNPSYSDGRQHLQQLLCSALMSFWSIDAAFAVLSLPLAISLSLTNEGRFIFSCKYLAARVIVSPSFSTGCIAVNATEHFSFPHGRPAATFLLLLLSECTSKPHWPLLHVITIYSKYVCSYYKLHSCSVCTGLLFFKNCFKVIFFHENYFFLL